VVRVIAHQPYELSYRGAFRKVDERNRDVETGSQELISKNTGTGGIAIHEYLHFLNEDVERGWREGYRGLESLIKSEFLP
jgi:hypothetical protein